MVNWLKISRRSRSHSSKSTQDLINAARRLEESTDTKIMSEWIRWCSCERRILTTRQMEENKPCEVCQKEHAQDFKDRFNNLKEEEK